jgi:hypothetical protein
MNSFMCQHEMNARTLWFRLSSGKPHLLAQGESEPKGFFFSTSRTPDDTKAPSERVEEKLVSKSGQVNPLTPGSVSKNAWTASAKSEASSNASRKKVKSCRRPTYRKGWSMTGNLIARITSTLNQPCWAACAIGHGGKGSNTVHGFQWNNLKANRQKGELNESDNRRKRWR